MSSAIPLEVQSVALSQHIGEAILEPAISHASRYFEWTSGLSRVIGLLLLIPATPLIGLLALITRLSSKGPGLYPQTRVGLLGQTFTLYKIRTMRQDAEVGTGPVWAQIKDPRVTFLGRILRSTHMDELPQLLNVVKGEMALVGPRPERPEFTQFLAREIPGYVQRLAIRPGITGLAQINLPPDTDVDSVRKKLALDLEYIRTAGLFMDLRIILCTAVRLIGIRGLTMATLVGLRRKPRDIIAASPGTYVKASRSGMATESNKKIGIHERQDTVSAPERHPSVSPAIEGPGCCELTATDSTPVAFEVHTSDRRFNSV